jgi:hypothetical protein
MGYDLDVEEVGTSSDWLNTACGGVGVVSETWCESWKSNMSGCDVVYEMAGSESWKVNEIGNLSEMQLFVEEGYVREIAHGKIQSTTNMRKHSPNRICYQAQGEVLV